MEFKSKEERRDWVLDFLLRTQLHEGSWVDLMFEGDLSFSEDGVDNKK
jgi:hypothetical protein